MRTETVTRPKVVSMMTAFNIYYEHYELDSAQIKELFGCSSSTATKLKKAARRYQEAQGVMTFSDTTVNTKCAYEAWGIDIADIEKRVRRYQKIKKEMTTE